jgi:hypothetical protein
MSISNQASSAIQTNTQDTLRLLQANLFVKQVDVASPHHYKLTLALNKEATETFVRFLSSTGSFLIKYDLTDSNKLSTVFIDFNNATDETIRKDLEQAFHKVSQFLEYLELKKEYAAGQVPLHLSQWLVEGNSLSA